MLASNEPVRFQDLSVTAIPVDHAAPDSRALLIEADGQRLLYTGDLRAHGRTGFRFENMLERRTPPRGRLASDRRHDAGDVGRHAWTGRGVRRGGKLVELARDTASKLIAVVASGQNLDRLVSCFRAAKRSGRLLVIDPYQAYVLMKLAPLSKSIPQFTWDGVGVSFAPHQVERLKQAGMMDLVYEMREQGKVDERPAWQQNRGAYLMCSRGGYGVTKVFAEGRAGQCRSRVVDVEWLLGARRVRDARVGRARRSEPQFIHSGGHAWPKDLRRLASAIAAKQTVWVHTDSGSPSAPA